MCPFFWVKVSIDEGEKIRKMTLYILNLHDFAKAALSYNLEQLKVLDLERLLAVLNKFDADSDLSSPVLYILPIDTCLASGLFLLSVSRCSLFLVFLAEFRVADMRLHLFKSGVYPAGANENVFVSPSVG